MISLSEKGPEFGNRESNKINKLIIANPGIVGQFLARAVTTAVKAIAMNQHKTEKFLPSWVNEPNAQHIRAITRRAIAIVGEAAIRIGEINREGEGEKSLNGWEKIAIEGYWLELKDDILFPALLEGRDGNTLDHQGLQTVKRYLQKAYDYNQANLFDWERFMAESKEDEKMLSDGSNIIHVNRLRIISEALKKLEGLDYLDFAKEGTGYFFTKLRNSN